MLEVAKRGRVTMLRGGYYIIPEPALQFLADEGYAYRLLEMMNHDDVVQALRNCLANPV